LIKIGITGGIGSGKTIVCSIIEKLGFPVFYSDRVSKRLVNTNESIIAELKSLLGDDIYKSNELDREQMAKKIFGNESVIHQVNNIIHPCVRSCFENWMGEQQAAIVFNEAAILFETGGYEAFDKNVLITAPEFVKISRVIDRDRITEEAVRARMRSQWTDEQKMKLADYVLVNDEQTGLLEQIENLITALLVVTGERA
jgi:dephospho-CoA kinase